MTDTNAPHRAGNGLAAAAYTGLAEVVPAAAGPLLSALGRARIAAYVEDSPADPAWQRLFVAAEDRPDARSVVVSAARDLPGSVRSLGDALPLQAVEDRFAALVGDWHVDTVNAIRSAERDLNREDAEWRARLAPDRDETPEAADEVEHYVPPAPPPLPRLSAATVCALLVLLAALAVLVGGEWIGLPGDLGFLVGVAGVLISAGMLVMRLRAHPHDDDDDGAVL